MSLLEVDRQGPGIGICGLGELAINMRPKLISTLTRLVYVARQKADLPNLGFPNVCLSMSWWQLASAAKSRGLDAIRSFASPTKIWIAGAPDPAFPSSCEYGILLMLL